MPEGYNVDIYTSPGMNENHTFAQALQTKRNLRPAKNGSSCQRLFL